MLGFDVELLGSKRNYSYGQCCRNYGRNKEEMLGRILEIALEHSDSPCLKQGNET